MLAYWIQCGSIWDATLAYRNQRKNSNRVTTTSMQQLVIYIISLLDSLVFIPAALQFIDSFMRRQQNISKLTTKKTTTREININITKSLTCCHFEEESTGKYHCLSFCSLRLSHVLPCVASYKEI